MTENTTDIRDIQLVELDILKAVAELCEKHRLRYFLYCGTLLGAIRHGGFIPWDDDVDIAMPLDDYRRFLEHASELRTGYVAQSPHDTPDAFVTWTKVCADGTTDMAGFMKGLDVHKGLGIDVYPMIGAAKSRFGSKAQSRALLLARWLRLGPYFAYELTREHRGSRGRRAAKRLIAALPSGLAHALSNALLAASMKDPEAAESVGTIDAAPFAGKYRRIDWEETTTVPFEGVEFRAPAAYDSFLKTMYGNYMQLPPEDKRRPSHAERDIIRDAHRDYREYERKMRGGSR